MSNWTPKQLHSQYIAAQKRGLIPLLVAAAEKVGLPPSYVVAVASRETRIQNIAGDGGHGHGVMQIDDRSHREILAAHPDWRTNPVPLIEYGARLLASNRTTAQKRWPAFDDRQLLKVAASAYNCGPGNAAAGVSTGDSDRYTTGHDYGRDVLARMRVFEELLG